MLIVVFKLEVRPMSKLVRFRPENHLHFSPQNARFWVVGPGLSWVKITLRPGQRVRHYRSFWNGEGMSWEAEEYHFDGLIVWRDSRGGGHDCDGYAEGGCLQACALHDLQSVGSYRPHYNSPGVLRPDWKLVENHPVFDSYARAAGY